MRVHGAAQHRGAVAPHLGEELHAADDGPAPSQRPEHAVAIQTRQHQIENDQVGPGVTGARQPFGPVLDHQNVVALDLEVVAQAEREIGIVLDYEDPRQALAPASARSGLAPVVAWACSTSGSSITNRLPVRPSGPDTGASSAQARPPCTP